jgi:hypothetical protein
MASAASEMRQGRTHALQQTAPLLGQLVGAAKQRQRCAPLIQINAAVKGSDIIFGYVNPR